jgi:hypothetical protein
VNIASPWSFSISTITGVYGIGSGLQRATAGHYTSWLSDGMDSGTVFQVPVLQRNELLQLSTQLPVVADDDRTTRLILGRQVYLCK